MTIVFPEIRTFGSGEFTDPRRLSVKILEESGELMVATKHEGREQMLDEFADVLQTLANFVMFSEITETEMAEAMERCLQRNIERGRL